MSDEPMYDETLLETKLRMITPALRRMYQLAERYSEASRLLSDQARGGEWGCWTPQMLTESLAVELYLKCLCVIGGRSKPPKTRDRVKLFNALGLDTQCRIRDEFERIARSHPALSILPPLHPDAVKADDFDTALRSGRNGVDHRRDEYQPPTREEWIYAQLLRAAVQAVVKLDMPLRG